MRIIATFDDISEKYLISYDENHVFYCETHNPVDILIASMAQRITAAFTSSSQLLPHLKEVSRSGWKHHRGYIAANALEFIEIPMPIHPKHDLEIHFALETSPQKKLSVSISGPDTAPRSFLVALPPDMICSKKIQSFNSDPRQLISENELNFSILSFVAGFLHHMLPCDWTLISEPILAILSCSWHKACAALYENPLQLTGLIPAFSRVSNILIQTSVISNTPIQIKSAISGPYLNSVLSICDKSCLKAGNAAAQHILITQEPNTISLLALFDYFDDGFIHFLPMEDLCNQLQVFNPAHYSNHQKFTASTMIEDLANILTPFISTSIAKQ